MEGTTLGGVPVVKPEQGNPAFAQLLWGSAGCGKTTLACTAPRPILLVEFDQGGERSVAGIPGVFVADFSASKHDITERMKAENPLGIEKFIEDNGIKTVVLDSLTTISDLCMENAIRAGGYTKKGKPIAIESPGLEAYQHKNARLLEIVKQFMKACKRKNVNLILISHENKPETDDDGHILYITMMLGGNLPEYVGLRLEEIWFVSDDGKEHKILIRPARMRKPIKSRMFNLKSGAEIVWKYDPTTDQGMKISDWWELYVKQGYKKIPVPK